MTLLNTLKRTAYSIFGNHIPGKIATDEDLRRSLGGYNRRRAVTAAASQRTARKRRNIAKRPPH